MFAILLAALLPFAGPQQPRLTPQQQHRIEQAKASFEVHRQAALRLNGMAQSIQSEGDARKFVDGVEEELFGHRDPIQSKLQSWITGSMRRRVARAEFAVSGPANLIPEQRVVDVWNEYVREIGAPDDTLVTVAEVHNLRDGMYTGSQRMWSRGGFAQSLWLIPGIYARDSNGKVAGGCRAIEALKVLHDMENTFISLKSARERVQKGVLVSDRVKQPQPDAGQPGKTAVRLSENPALDLISSCARRYSQEHGQKAYNELMDRLLQELFPA
jgi:hypothetical protein